MVIFYFRKKTITIDKTFYNKRKTITYKADVWLRAEKYFSEVELARQKGSDAKLNITEDLYLVTNLWGEQQNRYTGIHAFHIFGSVKPLSGVNLTDNEWNTLVTNFSKIKEILNGETVDFSISKENHDSEETIKVYVGNWMLNGKVMNPNRKEFFTEQEALFHARERPPVCGKDYSENEGVPEIRVECLKKFPPKDTDLMLIVYANYLNEKIRREVKENCGACQVNSDSQFEHFSSGNCLDETVDFVDLYYESAKQKLKTHELMNVFDGVRSKIGAKPILSKQLAKSAMAFISVPYFLDQVRKNQENTSSLIDIVRKVNDSITLQ